MSSFKAFLLISLSLLLIFQSYAHNEIECNHSKHVLTPGFVDIEEDGFNPGQGRMLTSSSSQFRIYAYYEFVQETAPSAFASYIQNDLIPPIVSYFEAALQVKYPVSGSLKVSKSVSTICERNTPAVLFSGVPADMFIYYDTFLQNSLEIAVTSTCYLSTGSNRPLIGRTLINRNMVKASTADVVLHEQNMYVFMHEFMHALAFSPSLYKYFLNDNGKTTNPLKTAKYAGITRNIIDVAPLTAKLQAFYGCSSLQGAIMENDGGDTTASSHFERKYFYFDAMTSGAIYGYRMTQFDLAFLEGSGWYTPDYSYAEPFYFGQGQGCSFFNNECGSGTPQFSEYCTGSQRGCSPEYGGGGSCYADSLMDGCRIYRASEDYYCQYADADDYLSIPALQSVGRTINSKCFYGTLSTRKSSSSEGSPNSFCFKYTCSGSGTSTKLTLQAGTQQVTCTKAETVTLSGYYGSITCPDPLTFCNTGGLKYCPKNCMGRGTCVNDVCQCKSGFSGIDCALRA